MTAERKFHRVLASVTDAEDMDRLLDEVLTAAERRDIELRWRLMELLETGLAQRDIARILGVSLCKITRGSRILKKPDSAARKLLR